jgi:hypothetical protein
VAPPRPPRRLRRPTTAAARAPPPLRVRCAVAAARDMPLLLVATVRRRPRASNVSARGVTQARGRCPRTTATAARARTRRRRGRGARRRRRPLTRCVGCARACGGGGAVPLARLVFERGCPRRRRRRLATVATAGTTSGRRSTSERGAGAAGGVSCSMCLCVWVRRTNATTWCAWGPGRTRAAAAARTGADEHAPRQSSARISQREREREVHCAGVSFRKVRSSLPSSARTMCYKEMPPRGSENKRQSSWRAAFRRLCPVVCRCCRTREEREGFVSPSSRLYGSRSRHPGSTTTSPVPVTALAKQLEQSV